jgi:RND family efflux transporter MFP subunit
MLLKLQNLSKEQKLLYVVIILITLLLVFRMTGGTSPDAETSNANDNTRTVQVYDFSQTNQTGAIIPTIGQIESLANVEVRAQTSERITSVNVRIGDQISAGQVLATLDTSNLRAQSNAAQANLNAAQAGLDELAEGARPEQLQIARSQRDNAQVAYNNSVSSLNNAVQSTYSTIEDVISNKTDVLYSNPQSSSPELVFSSGDFQDRTNLITARLRITDILNLETSSYTAEGALDDIDVVIAYLDTMSKVVNNLSNGSFPQSTVDGWKATVSGARASAQGAKTALLGAQEKESLTQTALQIAEDQLALTEAGASSQQLASGEARVDAAQAQLDTANLALSKAYITSPISGIVSAVPVRTGDLVSPGQLVASVVNTSGLKITTYINERDVALISLGSPAYIDNTQVGSVARIAPSINPETKKVEVEIALQDVTETFVVGQYVNVDVAISGSFTTVPLSSIRTNSQDNEIFIVNNDTAQLLKVDIERIFGEYAYISQALPNETLVITDPYGISNGDSVTVQK